MKKRTKSVRNILLLIVLVLVLGNLLGIGPGGGFLTGLFSKAVPASNMSSQPSGPQILVSEDRVYLNHKLVDIDQLAVRLKDLKSETDQMILKEEQAKRVTYNQVETLLQEMGFRTQKR